MKFIIIFIIFFYFLKISTINCGYCSRDDLTLKSNYFYGEIDYLLVPFALQLCNYRITGPRCTDCKFGYTYSGKITNNADQCNLITETSIKRVYISLYSDANCKNLYVTRPQNNFECQNGFQINLLDNKYPQYNYEFLGGNGIKYNATSLLTNSSYMMHECDRKEKDIHVGGLVDTCMTYCNADDTFKSIIVHSDYSEPSTGSMIDLIIILVTVLGILLIAIITYCAIIKFIKYKKNKQSKVMPCVTQINIKEHVINIDGNIDDNQFGKSKKSKKTKKSKKSKKADKSETLEIPNI